QILLPELARRQIHRNRNRVEAGVLPGPVLPARGLQHPLPDRHDKPGFFRERDETPGSNEPQLSALPSNKGLGAHEASAANIDLWLICQQEFLALERSPQLGLETELLGRLGVEGIGIDLVVVASL